MNKEKYTQIKPSPPNDLDNKSLSIWATWCTMGEKEVAREAVMKGTHIPLAKQYLSKKLDIDDTDLWFKNEINSWILDLLLRKQIYRATHIFQNMGVDAFEEVLTIFLDTCCKELRENVGNHLLKHDKLSEILKNNWNLLSAIEEQSDILMPLKEKYISLNLRCIEGQSEDWKNLIGTEIFFRSFNFNLRVFIDQRTAWKHLLMTNVNLIKYWINVQYNGDTSDANLFDLNTESIEQLREIFMDLGINDELISMIAEEDSTIDKNIQNEILDELAKFGIFDKTTQGDLFKLIRRFANIGGLRNIENVFSLNSSNVTTEQFYNLIRSYCESNSLFHILNIFCEKINFNNSENDGTNLVLNTYNMHRNLNDLDVLRNNIFDTAKFLSDDDNLHNYFDANPIVLLSIVLFTKDDVTMGDLLSNRVACKIRDFEVNKEVISNSFKNCVCFRHFCQKFDNSIDTLELNFYDLLGKQGVNVNNLYKYRFKNEQFPNFNSVDLIDTFGYKKRLDFVYFLKNSRPMYAYNFFKTVSIHGLNDEYVNVMDKVYRVALISFKSVEIGTSCVAFLEMLGENSYPLRLYLKMAKVICNSGKIPEKEVIRLFLDISGNSEEIFSLLETAIVDNVNVNDQTSGADLIRILKSHSIVVRFATLHKLQLPEMLLKVFAVQNLWLPFLIYVQIYNYPIDIASKLTQNFTGKSLIEHLSHAVSHDIQIEESKNRLMGERDSRKYFLSRLGVRLTTDSSGSSSDMSSHSSYGSMANSVGSDFLENEMLDYPTDLLEVLIKCHNSADPPKALLYASRYYKSPLLAVLANSYEPDSVIMNWVTWLEVSCEIESSFINYDGIITTDSVLQMFRDIMERNYFKTLTDSFCIFLKENPLRIFMEFLYEATRLNFDPNLREILRDFKEKITFWRSNSYISEIDHDMSYFNNKHWIQNAAFFLLCNALQFGFRCYYDQILFLRFVNDIDISQYFLVNVPDVKKFLKINEYIYEQQNSAAFDLSILCDKNRYHKTITSYIDELVERGSYDVALRISTIMETSRDAILFKQWRSEFDNAAGGRDEKSWKNWDDAFEKYQINPNGVVRNYINILEFVDDDVEIFTILKLTFGWTDKYNLIDKVPVEKEMWLSYFKICDRYDFEMSSRSNFTLFSEYTKQLEILPDCYDVLNQVQLENFEKTAGEMLNKGDIGTALRLEKIFGYNDTDLDILKLCLCLVEGVITPQQLNAKQRLLLNRRSNAVGSSSIRRKNFLTARMSSCTSITSLSGSTFFLNDSTVTSTHDTLSLLETLVDNLRSGTRLALNILKTYRISVNLQTSYRTVLECKDPINTLRIALENDCWNKLETVGDFIDIFELTKEQIADLLYEEISTSIANYSISRMNICCLWELNMETDFNLILQLLQDNCSLLGFKLYYGCNGEFTTGNTIRVTELLIRSHDCFTVDCNMEGISMVLKKCKSFTSLLEGMREYNLMVRLLTGIARYSEMTYVFHTLKQQEQFELLLRRGIRKDAGLKIALLEYLKRYCPDDLELYKIVALHFFLFSEIAELWEDEAARSIRRIVALAKLEMQNFRLNPETEPYIVLVNTEDNKRMLRKIMMKYSHASEYHLHGQKLLKAMISAKQAQLVALQLSLFKDLAQNDRVMCILSLTNAQIAKLTLSEFSFESILILIEAYNFEADWSGILYEQFLVKDRVDFFQSFARSLPITEPLVNDISKLFLSCTNTTDSMCKNMQTVLNSLRSIHAKYRIASELGFANLVEELLNGHQLSYLKDTVWKNGYKNDD